MKLIALREVVEVINQLIQDSEMVAMEFCRRCRVIASTVVTRKEPFCDDCFQNFVSAKQRKQMMCESFCQEVFKVLYQDKVRSEEEALKQNAQSKVLVPLSFGSSSLVLLDILNDTLTEQKETQRGKTGFHIDVLICGSDSNSISGLKERANRLLTGRFASNQESIKFHFVSVESFYQDCGEQLETISIDGHNFSSRSVLMKDRRPEVQELLKQCPDKSSRQDLLRILSRNVIKKFAYQNKHKLILWGHSMTKLADETISLVVKGRGSQIAPLLNNEEPDPLFEKSFKNLYPLQDVLLSEIDAYCYVKNLDSFLIDYVPQDSLLVEKRRDPDLIRPPRSVKNLTLDEIARKYFDDVEADYANVISTVVRTALKLGEPKTPNPKRCLVCRANVHIDPSTYLTAITVSEIHPVETDEEIAMYAKWKASRSSHDSVDGSMSEGEASQEGTDSPLCYGCMTNLIRMKEKKLTWPKSRKSGLETILDTFELT